MSDFEQATAVIPAGAGKYRLRIDPDWFAGAGPNGGYLAGVALRALIAHTADRERHPLSLTCHFLSAAHAGECDIDVTTEREGKGITALSARMHQDGETVMLALATLGVEREGMIDFETPAPSVPRPEDLSPPAIQPWSPPIFHRLDYRPCIGEPMLSGSSEALIGGWTALKERTPLDEPALAMFADAWPPASWVRLTRPAVAPTIDMTFHFRSRIAPGTEWALVRMDSTTSRHGFVEENGEIWSPEGTLLAQSRQLALLRQEVYE